eukprot:CAMPEP_0204513428 /NCGR_PEP_ID=MMETSP0661-20131031/1501_1 /ASSEMBLY_ACC=CAM_ASM_000606 /TAXON_ID=109239 /ORGANISM="Alexandrium margalefi, Strain AMGDE01CS-322" /LENGTH=754 /DNA_ID=CAMNT_0051518601 /DNA_START=18 /DNA_END=2280 /DNA_ORIENTATION=+
MASPGGSAEMPGGDTDDVKLLVLEADVRTNYEHTNKRLAFLETRVRDLEMRLAAKPTGDTTVVLDSEENVTNPTETRPTTRSVAIRQTATIQEKVEYKEYEANPEKRPPTTRSTGVCQTATIQEQAEYEESHRFTQASSMNVEQIRSRQKSEWREAVRDTEHNYGGTLWDLVLIIGLPMLGRRDSISAVMGWAMNVLAQCFVCWVVLPKPTFGAADYETLSKQMERWRYIDGHDVGQVNALHGSLASRVCGVDESLSVGARQMQTIQDINDYLDLDFEAFEMTANLGTGPILLIICILILSSLVFGELRQVWSGVRAIWTLPKGETLLCLGHIQSISWARLVIFYLNSAMRAAIAITILISGTIWLCATLSISELVLNAAALSVVMDLDEQLFLVTIPIKVQNCFKRMVRVQYKHPHQSCEALICLILIFGVIAAAYFTTIQPNTEAMLGVKRSICGGNLNIKATMNPAGYAVSTRQTPFSPDARLGTAGEAVRELVHAPQLSVEKIVYSAFMVAPSDYERHLSYSLQKLTAERPCQDAILVGRELLKWTPAVMLIRETTGVKRGLAPAQYPFLCQEYTAFCNKQGIALLRLICPVTCGCHSWTSGLTSVSSEQGCPTKCATRARDDYLGQACVDIDTRTSTTWVKYWNGVAATFLYQGIPEKTTMAFTTMKRMAGCASTIPFPIINQDPCNTNYAPTSQASAQLRAAPGAWRSMGSAPARATPTPATPAAAAADGRPGGTPAWVQKGAPARLR